MSDRTSGEIMVKVKILGGIATPSWLTRELYIQATSWSPLPIFVDSSHRQE